MNPATAAKMNKAQETNENAEPTVVESGIIEVTAKKDGKEATVPFNFGKNLQDAIGLYGEDVVFSRYRAAAKIDLQSVMRRYLDAGKDCQDLLTVWKPGVTLERIVDPKATAKNAFAKMSPEEQADFLAELKESVK